MATVRRYPPKSRRIKYPFIPKERRILYVPITNTFMLIAREYAKKHSLDKAMPGAAVLVKDGKIIGIGANGSDYHTREGCRRVELGCKTGEGYRLCPGCSPENHSEYQAIKNAWSRKIDPAGADLYLWGHWWCCEDCWRSMVRSFIENVYLLKDSHILFNKEHRDNIVGRQFEA